MTMLDEILRDVRDEISAAKLRRTPSDIRAMMADVAGAADFAGALHPEFGLIAEIKECSPSVGPMRKENVDEAPASYEESGMVKAVSILTNSRHFGMDVVRLSKLRGVLSKPILRKDFFLDEYQIREARAFGADAVLLMANVLDAARLKGFYELTRELGMEALFEVHTKEEIAILPADARVIGINSRKFKSEMGFVEKGSASQKDFSIDYTVFELTEELPDGVLKIAESGLDAGNIKQKCAKFNAALVGTSLLRDPRGIRAGLAEFEEALR